MELSNAINAMESNYAKVHVCSYKDKAKCDLQLDPGKIGFLIVLHVFILFLMFLWTELTDILLESDDPEELKYYWKQWYDLAGTPTRKDFETYLRLNKEAAQLNSKHYIRISLPPNEYL